jgi:hypothetical protein
MVPQSQTYCRKPEYGNMQLFQENMLARRSKIEKKYNTLYLGISVPPYSHFL